MILSNPHELTQLHFNTCSLIGITEQLTGKKPSNEINPGQNFNNYKFCIRIIRQQLDRLENDFNEAHKK